MKSETEILKLLDTDPNAGMVCLMERYLPLVHSVAAALGNGEDIKECINDTFGDFYLYRGSFDPEKGRLEHYLVAIARRKCADIANARKKHAASQLPEAAEAVPTDWDQYLDLRQAIARLPEADAELIRRKYYQGQTLEQIAQSLGIRYETAKKRHQRSLAALKKLLMVMVLLLLAALAACSVLLLRHFGILPGYGLQELPGQPQMVLEEGATVRSQRYVITLEDAWLHADVLQFRLQVRCTDPGAFADEGMPDLVGITALAEGTEGKLSLVSQTVQTEEQTVTAVFQLQQPRLTQDAAGALCSLRIDDRLLQFRVKQVQVQPVEQSGFSVQTPAGGIHAIPRIENGHLLVQIYPMDPEGYRIDRNLSEYHMKRQFGLSGAVTAVAEDGSVLTGVINREASHVSEEFYEWDFGEAAPGRYTLRIPFLFVTSELPAQTQMDTVLPFDGTDGTTLDTPCGALNVGPVQALEKTEDGQFAWYIPVTGEMKNPYRLLAAQIHFLPDYGTQPEQMVPFSQTPVVEAGRLAAYRCGSPMDVLQAKLQLHTLTFLWECDLSVNMQVS